MSKRKSPKVYAAHVKELRHYAKGFTAADGFDMRRPNTWTPAQKATITRYAEAARQLTARENILFRSRNEDNLRRVQRDAGQHPPGTPRFKVAFVPYTQKPGDPRPEIVIRKDVISVAGEHWTRTILPLNPRRLVRDPAAEVHRALADAPGAKSYTIQAGAFEIQRAAYDEKSLVSAITALMARYDGRRALPASSGNRGDSPKAHNWRNWLTGVIAYKFKNRANAGQLLRAMQAAKDKRRRDKDAARQRAKRAKQAKGAK